MIQHDRFSKDRGSRANPQSSQGGKADAGTGRESARPDQAERESLGDCSLVASTSGSGSACTTPRKDDGLFAYGHWSSTRQRHTECADSDTCPIRVKGTAP